MAPLSMAEHDMNAKSVIPRSKIKYIFLKLSCCVLFYISGNLMEAPNRKVELVLLVTLKQT